MKTNEEEQDWPSFIDTSGREVRVSRTRVYDPVAQILHWTTSRRWHKGEEGHTKVTRHRAALHLPAGACSTAIL